MENEQNLKPFATLSILVWWYTRKMISMADHTILAKGKVELIPEATLLVKLAGILIIRIMHLAAKPCVFSVGNGDVTWITD
jgi:hypothetical protein